MYHSDRPIESSRDDLLGRSKFANQLARSILEMDHHDIFTIALYGKWGSGKTSVLNMMCSEISCRSKEMPDTDKPVVIRFEPWNYSDRSQLIQQFFSQLSCALSIENQDAKLHDIGKKIEKYGSGLDLLEYIPVAGPYLKIIPSLVENIGEGISDKAQANLSDLSKQKQEITDALSKISNRIIVTIDNIDRLTKEEIRLIFQLVSSVADFPNTIYVLSMDREVVVQALTDVQNCSGSDYMEKIVQIPFELPAVSFSKIQQLFLHSIEKLAIEYNITLNSDDYWQIVFQDCISPYIDTLRDIVRITNVLELKLAILKKEVNFCDLAAISTLQVTQPLIYDWIVHHPTILVGCHDQHEQLLSLLRKEKEKTREEFMDEFRQIAGDQSDSMFRTLTTLFPYFASQFGSSYSTPSEDVLRRERRIGLVDWYDRYFSLSLDGVAVPVDEMNRSVFEYDETELVPLLHHLEDDAVTDYLLELKSYVEKIPLERIPIFIRVFMENGSFLPGERSGFLTPISSETLSVIIVEDLFRKLESVVDRETLLLDGLNTCTEASISMYSLILHRLEVSSGRISSETPRTKTIAISDEALDKLEQLIIERYQYLFDEMDCDLFLQPKARTICVLWSLLDKDNYQSTMKTILSTPERICRYLTLSVNHWTGSGSRWEVENDSDELISKDESKDAILSILEDGSFFKLETDLQRDISAFYIGKLTDHTESHITEEDIRCQLESWHQQYYSITRN